MRIIIMLLVLFLVILPACNKIRSVFFDSGEKYVQSFEDFVEGVNKMELGTDTNPTKQEFPIKLEIKRAMVGFRSDADKFECFNCWDKDKKYVYDKPRVDECEEKACVCLCRDELKFEEIKSEGKKVKVGKCDYLCKNLKEDIIEQTVTVNERRGTNIIWNNGFLFAGLLSTAGGIDPKLINQLYVDKTLDTIAVCNDDMLRHNEEIGIDGCMDIKTVKEPAITQDELEGDGKDAQKILLKRKFEGFVGIIGRIEMYEGDPKTICRKDLDLTGFEEDQFITFDKAGDKGRVSLKKLEGGNLVDISPPREIERLIPYASIGNVHGVISQLLADDVYQQDIENFREYLLRPKAIGLFKSDPYNIINFQGSSNQKAILIHGNGNWILTSNEDVSSTIHGSSVLTTELKVLCW